MPAAIDAGQAPLEMGLVPCRRVVHISRMTVLAPRGGVSCMESNQVICQRSLTWDATYRTWENFGGRKFWRIITDEANGEENFGESAGRSSVISLYL